MTDSRSHARARSIAAAIRGIPLERPTGVAPKAAPFVVRWVREFLRRPATDFPIVEQVRVSARNWNAPAVGKTGKYAKRSTPFGSIFINFFNRTDLQHQSLSAVVDAEGRTPLSRPCNNCAPGSAHDAIPTARSAAMPIGPAVFRLFGPAGWPAAACHARRCPGLLDPLATRQRLSASTQNQAQSAVVFLCREVLSLETDGLSQVTRAKRGERLPVVLSVP